MRAGALGILAALIAAGVSGWAAAVGAFAGSVFAGMYSVGYLRSHLAAAGRAKPFQADVAGRALGRLGALAVAAAATFAISKVAFLAFLVAFGVALAALVALELPRIMRQFRGPGLGGRRP